MSAIAARNALAAIISAPCFLCFFYFLYECFVFVSLHLCGQKREGIIQRFSWTIRDGLTTLWCCDRGKWRPAESQRPQIWHILFRPLGSLPDGTYGNYTFKNDEGAGRQPTKCDRCCMRTGIHLTRVEMTADASNKKIELDTVQLNTCSFLCCIRADLAKITNDRLCDCFFMISTSLVCATCAFLCCLGFWYIFAPADNNLRSFYDYMMWPIGTAVVLSLLCLLCNCGYVRYERYPTRFYSNIKNSYVHIDDKKTDESAEPNGIELSEICISANDGDY